MAVDFVLFCNEGTGWWSFPSRVVVARAEAVGASCASIDAVIFGDLEVLAKEEEDYEGCGGIGFSHNG